LRKNSRYGSTALAIFMTIRLLLPVGVAFTSAIILAASDLIAKYTVSMKT
jgi:hypothetical protein